MDKEIAIDAKGVWKVFGERSKEALKAIHAEGLSKAEVLDRFNCVVGVADASFEIEAVATSADASTLPATVSAAQQD